ncbi:MAG: YciI family protein [Myxococcales bacterium]
MSASTSSLKTEMTKASVLESSCRLAPSRNAKRLFFTDQELRMVDGPFAESKELIGGFLLMELANVDAAVEACQRYLTLHGGIGELDLREVEEWNLEVAP